MGGEESQAVAIMRNIFGNLLKSLIGNIGFNVETVDYKNIRFIVWDVDGQDKIRPLWRRYFQNTQGLILVVDSNDRERNLPNAMNAAEITDKLGLHSLRHRNRYIQATCTTSGDSLYKGLNWLANQLKNKK